MSNRAMVKLIHADGFFPPGDAEKYCQAVSGLPFVDKQYGKEIENLNMILPGMEPILSKVLGERVVIDSSRSGIFRKPMDNIIHFEEFDTLNEWCFVVALERTTLNIFHHLANYGKGAYGEIDAKTALDGWQFNYRNLFEWDLNTNILLEPNQGVFFRPWVFHSLQDGLVQYYRLITDKKFRVLIMGAHGTSRSIVAEQVAATLPGSKLVSSKKTREEFKDVDYSDAGKDRHAHRMLNICRTAAEDCVIVDMACTTQSQREVLNPDIIVWVDDAQASTDFEKPMQYDLKYTAITDSSVTDIIERINTKRY